MGFSLKFAQDVNTKEWDGRLAKNTASTVYQTANWPKIYRDTYNSKPFYIWVEDGSGEIVGQLTLVLHNKLFWQDANMFSSFLGNKLNLRSTMNWFYGPIIHDKANHSEIISLMLQKINEISEEHKITMVRGISPPLDINFTVDPFKKFEYGITPWSTYITDLQTTEENLFRQLGKKTRYDIKKSEKNDLHFEIADSIESYQSFQKLKVENKKKEGMNIKLNNLFAEKHWEHLFKNDQEKLFLAKHNDNVVGGILCLIFNGNVIQHGVGNTSDNLLQGSFLTWNALKWSLNSNLKTYDMAGINPNPESKKEKNINFYKSKWGGKEHEYILFTKILQSLSYKVSSVLKNPKKIISKKFNTN